MFKGIFSVIVALMMCCACAKKNFSSPLSRWMEPNGKIKILSTIAQIGDLAGEIGGERVDVWTLISGDLDPHSYDLVKGDGEKFSRADLIFFNGLGLEHGASLSSLLFSNEKAISLGYAIQNKTPEKIIQKEGVFDPHIWMDVSLWEGVAEEIEERLSLIDPEGAPYYREKVAALKKKMAITHSYMRATLQKVPSNQRFLVTSHDAFHYFARAYLAEEGEADWANRFTAPEGLAPDGQLNPADIRFAIDFLQSHNIRVVFPESNISRDVVAKIASASRELGFDVRVCKEPLYGDSMSGLSYLEMMRSNANVIANHLQEGN